MARAKSTLRTSAPSTGLSGRSSSSTPACCAIFSSFGLLRIVYNIAHNTMPRISSPALVRRATARTPKRLPFDAGVSVISARLEEDIVLGRLQPRERLVEQDLADRFGTHRAAVRQALFDLDKKGLINRVPNAGALVRSLSPHPVPRTYPLPPSP